MSAPANGVVRRLPTNRMTQAVILKTPPSPATALPPYQWTCPNFLNGKSITWRLRKGKMSFQVDGYDEHQTDETWYAPAAAIARRLYGVPAIGCQSIGPIPE
jgi:hypothetical protein